MEFFSHIICKWQTSLYIVFICCCLYNITCWYAQRNLASLARAKLLNFRTHMYNNLETMHPRYSMGMWQSSNPIILFLSFVIYWTYNATVISRVSLAPSLTTLIIIFFVVRIYTLRQTTKFMLVELVGTNTSFLFKEETKRETCN